MSSAPPHTGASGPGVATTRLLVFADDWGRHPSSCQHLVRRLLDDWPTLWVNTIGTRKPRLDRATLRRGWEKLAGARSNGHCAAPLPPNLRVVSPLMWPYFSRAHDRWINQRLLTRALAPALAGAGPVTALTTLPLTADLVGKLPVARWVYYCVDDFSQWPGLDGETLARMECDLLPRVDRVVAASAVLRDRLQALGRSDVALLTHGVDLAAWQTPATDLGEKQEEAAALWPDPAALERPWIVFWGLIDRRLDLAWIEALSRRLERGTLLFVGPQQEFDPRLAMLPRVALRPPLPPERLPALARQAAVLMMPYADLPVTRAMQPLKLLEYLASARPVVVRDLPAVAEWRDALDACADADHFVSAILARLASGLPAAQHAARARLGAHDWSAKARELGRILGAE